MTCDPSSSAHSCAALFMFPKRAAQAVHTKPYFSLFHFAPEHTVYFWIFKVRLQQGLCITYVTLREKKVFRTFSDFNHMLILLFSISGVKINEGRVPPCSLLPLLSQHLKLSQAEFSLLMKNPAADYIKVCLCFV